MKTEKELKQSLYELTQSQLENLKWAKKEIEDLEKDRKITESNLKRVSNLISELNTLKEVYINKLFWALKQNHKL